MHVSQDNDFLLILINYVLCFGIVDLKHLDLTNHYRPWAYCLKASTLSTNQFCDSWTSCNYAWLLNGHRYGVFSVINDEVKSQSKWNWDYAYAILNHKICSIL